MKLIRLIFRLMQVIYKLMVWDFFRHHRLQILHIRERFLNWFSRERNRFRFMI
jgi:hypothetical protein